MRPIFAKELRGLVPLWVLCFLAISGDLLFRPITERLDENSWADISAIEAGSGGDLAFVFGVLAFVVAYAAFPREHDEGTMGYLRSLPVSRSGIFFGKVLAGLTVLVSSVAIGQFTNFILASFSPQTFEGSQFRWSTSLTLVLIQGSFVVAMYCHGVFASFFRRFGLLPYTLVFWVAQIAENIDPTLSWLSPVSMVRLTYFGQTLLVPVGPIVGHLIVAFAMLALAGFLWLGPTERVREFIAPREGRSGWAALGFGCATAILVFVMFCAVIFLAVSNAPDGAGQEPEAAEYVSFSTADAQTEHYAFTYPINLRERALRLVGVADATFEAARATLGATASDGPISVDLAEVSSSHEGIAAGARVRMGLVSQSDLRLRYVLAHESTHVFQGRESRSRLAEAGPAGRFLSEGSADWVAHEVVDAPQMRAASRVVAAASWERHGLRFEDIVDDDTLRARYDTTLVYSLGEAWSEALERACGEHALGRLLRALAADDAPRDLGGFGIVQDGLQRAGCSYERVDAAWVALLTQTAADSRAALDALPRMGASVEPGQDAVHVRIAARLDRPAPEGATFSVRFRRDRSSEDSQMRGAQGRVESPQRVIYEMPTSVVPSARFELQLCVAPEHTTWTYCEPWQAASLP